MTVWTTSPADVETSYAASALITRLLPRLHAASTATLVWWTETELVAWIDRALKTLATSCSMFMRRATALTANGSATYDLPADHVSSRHVSLTGGYSGNGTLLQPSTASELQALDDAYETTTALPLGTGLTSRWYQDELGMAVLGLYAVPTSIETMALIYRRAPAVAAAADLIAAPRVVAAYLEDSALAEAYAKESDAAMPEVKPFLEHKLRLFEQVAREYWGGGL